MYWPAPLLALVVSMINTGISKGLTGNVADESDLCGIPGLTTVLPSFVAPQLILFSGTILAYIASFNTAIKSESTTLPFTSIIAPWALFGAVILLQITMLYKSGCLAGYYFTYSWVSILIAIAAALAIGGGAGAGFATLPFFRNPPPGALVIPATANKLGPGGITPYTPVPPPDKSSDPNVGTCSPPNDQDQFVCEAYKNGELITSTITEGFIGK